MHIAIMMFAKYGGGIEQAFVDYCEGLRDRGHQVSAVVYPGSWAADRLKEVGIEPIGLRNFSEYDVIAVMRLRRLLKSLAPEAIITHGNRATGMAIKAKTGIPVIGVVNNYSTRRYSLADAAFTTTRDLVATLVDQGIAKDRVFLIPNMVKVVELPHRDARHQPPVIGTMGRFVKKKGFDTYIHALAILKKRGIEFKALLGGSGIEEGALRALAKEHELSSVLEFTGWIENRHDFYQRMDIFCLPSLHEPFGIVLLEAFANGVPIISSDSEGPKDIITPNYDALIVEKANAAQMAEAMEKLIKNPAKCEELAANGFAKVKSVYSLDVVAIKIEEALIKMLNPTP